MMWFFICISVLVAIAQFAAKKKEAAKKNVTTSRSTHNLQKLLEQLRSEEEEEEEAGEPNWVSSESAELITKAPMEGARSIKGTQAPAEIKLAPAEELRIDVEKKKSLKDLDEKQKMIVYSEIMRPKFEE